MIPSRLAAVLLLAATPLATAGAAPPAESPVVAREGTETLTAADVSAMLASLDPATRAHLIATPGGVENLVRSRLATDALLAEANAKNWAARPEIARAIAAARDGVVAKSYLASVSEPPADYPGDAAIAAAYDANKAEFVQPRTYQLQQVVLPGADDPVTRRRAEAEARAFPVAAATDLGAIPENRLVPAIRAAVGGLAIGGATAVHLDDGWHVLRLVATRPATTLALAAVRDQIATALRREKADANARAYLSALEARQHAAINEIALSAAASGSR